MCICASVVVLFFEYLSVGLVFGSFPVGMVSEPCLWEWCLSPACGDGARSPVCGNGVRTPGGGVGVGAPPVGKVLGHLFAGLDFGVLAAGLVFGHLCVGCWILAHLSGPSVRLCHILDRHSCRLDSSHW